MCAKALKSLAGKPFTGELAKPIDTKLFMPLTLESKEWPKYLAQKALLLSAARIVKLPELAKHLDIDPARFLSKRSGPNGLMELSCVVLMELAAHVVPGFQEKPRGKNPREIIRFARQAIDIAKASGKVDSDLDACREILKLEQPHLAQRRNKSELDKKAKSLRNLVAKDRAASGRSKNSLHRMPSLSIVKH